VRVRTSKLLGVGLHLLAARLTRAFVIDVELKRQCDYRMTVVKTSLGHVAERGKIAQ
jgi:hypothetical protein